MHYDGLPELQKLTSFPEEVDWHKIQHEVLNIIDLLLKRKL